MMAEKRMLSKVISISEKVNLLPDVFDMLLFTWMIPHTDDFGRMGGSPAKIKALVIPMLDKGIADVARSLDALATAGLILLYEAEGDRVAQIVNFEKHQQGLHKRTKSKFPDPPKESDSVDFPDVPGTSGNFRNIPSELNRTEQKGTEGKGTPAQPDSPPPEEDNRDHIQKIIKDCDVEMDLFSLDQVFSFIGVVEMGVIEAAIKKSSGKSTKYTAGVLEGWMKESKTKLEHIYPKAEAASKSGRLDFLNEL